MDLRGWKMYENAKWIVFRIILWFKNKTNGDKEWSDVTAAGETSCDPVQVLLRSAPAGWRGTAPSSRNRKSSTWSRTTPNPSARLWVTIVSMLPGAFPVPVCFDLSRWVLTLLCNNVMSGRFHLMTPVNEILCVRPVRVKTNLSHSNPAWGKRQTPWTAGSAWR